MNKFKLLSLSLLTSIFSSSAFSEAPQQHRGINELQSEIQKMDHLLFDVAFNTCDLNLYKKIIAKDLEFYDDRSGLNKAIEKEIRSFEDRCSKPFSVTRKLTASEVHGLGDYGAVQIGSHEFYQDGKKVEKAQFIIIWERKADAWIMKRTISYDHQGVKNEPDEG